MFTVSWLTDNIEPVSQGFLHCLADELSSLFSINVWRDWFFYTLSIWFNQVNFWITIYLINFIDKVYKEEITIAKGFPILIITHNLKQVDPNRIQKMFVEVEKQLFNVSCITNEDFFKIQIIYTG